MARLIVLDASVAVAALAVDDAHHVAATGAIAASGDDELVLAATTRAEVLVGPSRTSARARKTALDFVNACSTVPVTEDIADAAATLKARHRALCLPDAITLVVGDLVDADAVWTFDGRWSGASPRVVVP